ncbi:MAG: hypothetical protein ACI8WT_004111, partial [Clostridium sp.]
EIFKILQTCQAFYAKKMGELIKINDIKNE